MANQPTPHNWLMTLGLSGLAAAYLLLFFLPHQRVLARLRDEFRGQQEVLSQSYARLGTMAATQRRLDASINYNARWTHAMPGENSLPVLYGRINALAKQEGVATKSFDPQPGTEYERFRVFNVAINCRGSFSQISHFLQSLERLPMTLWLDTLRMENGVKMGKMVDCELNLAVFVDKPEESGQAKASGQSI
jgi:Tfp pilus assembly protein PilO